MTLLGIQQAREMGKTKYNLWPNLSHVFLSIIPEYKE